MASFLQRQTNRMRPKILLINTQLAELHISGLTNRFVGLWCYLQKGGSELSGSVSVHWLTNHTLWEKHFPSKLPGPNVTVIAAARRFFRFTARFFYPLYVVYLFHRLRCTSVHIATSIIHPIYLLRVLNLFRVPYCLTYAANSIEMGAFGSERMRQQWAKLFMLAKNIDVLNPTNTINAFRERKFVPPTSFPYITQLHEIQEEEFLHPHRDNTIVFCGSLSPQKNPLLAVEGFRFFLRNSRHAWDNPAQLVIIGKGELLSAVQEEVAAVNLESGRKAIKIIADTSLIATLARSKVFLSLQDYDNYPSQSVMEAMLFCNSVISINNGDTARLVDPGNGNILLAGKDAAQLGAAIDRLLSNWQLNVRNREHVLSRFSVEAFAKYFYDLHAQITSGAGDRKATARK